MTFIEASIYTNNTYKVFWLISTQPWLNNLRNLTQRPKSPLGVAETKAGTILTAKSVKNTTSRSWQTSGKGINTSTSFKRPYRLSSARFALDYIPVVKANGGRVDILTIKQH